MSHVVDSRAGLVLFLLVWLGGALLFVGLALARARRWPWLAAAGWLVLGWPIASLTVLAIL
jgi:hypothetical protein